MSIRKCIVKRLEGYYGNRGRQIEQSGKMERLRDIGLAYYATSSPYQRLPMLRD